MTTQPRHILASNLKRLMQQHPALDTLPKLTEASGVSNGTRDRIRRAAVATRVDELEPIAKAFGLHAWQLLVPPAES